MELLMVRMNLIFNSKQDQKGSFVLVGVLTFDLVKQPDHMMTVSTSPQTIDQSAASVPYWQ